MEVFHHSYDPVQLREYVGDLSQLADVREGVLTAGKADGVRVIDVKTAKGLAFSVLPTRGMDIAWASYKGIPLSFISKSGVVHPAYFEKDGFGFLRGFTCGLLTTCGLTYMGAPCEDAGEELGLHGRISNIPAENVSVSKGWQGDEYVLSVSGEVSESKMFGENIKLRREFRTTMDSAVLEVHDVVENCGFDKQPFMLLYHLNFGFPLVSEGTVLVHEKAAVTPRDDEAAKGIAQYHSYEKPTAGYQEQVFYLDFNACGKAYCGLWNEKLNLGVNIRFHTDEFRYFGLWKMMGKGDYVVGLEPSTQKPEGRAKARERGELEFLMPGEKREYTFTIEVVENKSDIR